MLDELAWTVLSSVLRAVQATQLDDQIAANVAQQIKDAIPGHVVEPAVADFLEIVSKELKKSA